MFGPVTMDYDMIAGVIYFVGAITISFIAGLLVLAILLVSISVYSIRKGHLFLPGFLRAGFVLVEGISKALFRFIGLEEKEMVTFFINLHNTMTRKDFAAIPVRERAIFFPQCLRSAKCPAHLSPEGLKCVGCGECPFSTVTRMLESLGYTIFIVPGSSFIKRMVKKYHPRGIIGVGCLTEVKEGIDMCDKLGLTVLGVVTTKEGCVETTANWDDIFDVALLGIDPVTIPDDLKRSPWYHIVAV
jgi:uncharacterized protein